MSVQSSDEDGLTVPCTSGVETTTWRESPLTGGLLAFKRLCGSCFPELSDRDDLDAADVPVDRVVRSTSRQAPALHLHPNDVDDHDDSLVDARSTARADGGRLVSSASSAESVASNDADSDPDAWVEISSHVETRWRQRARTQWVGPRVAWYDGEPLDVADDKADELRYHKPSETVLARIDDTLTTVMAAPTARPAIRAAVDDLGGEST